MCVIPHLCHTQTAITAKITGHLVPSVLGSRYSWLWRAVWRLTTQKDLNKLESQESDWPVGIWNTWLHRELRWKVDRCPKSPVSSFFSVFVVWLSFASRNIGEVFPLPTQLCKFTEEPHHEDFSGHPVSCMNPAAWGRLLSVALLWETQAPKPRERVGEPVRHLAVSYTKNIFFSQISALFAILFVFKCPNPPKTRDRNCGDVSVTCIVFLCPSCDTLKCAVPSTYDQHPNCLLFYFRATEF